MPQLRSRNPATPSTKAEETSSSSPRLRSSRRNEEINCSKNNSTPKRSMSKNNTPSSSKSERHLRCGQKNSTTTPVCTPPRAKPDSLRKQALKMKIRKSIVENGRAKHVDFLSTEDEEESQVQEQETPGRKSRRLAGETINLKDVALGAKRKFESSPKSAPREKNLKLRVRKSMIARGRQAAFDNDSDEDVSELLSGEDSENQASGTVTPLTGREIEFNSIDSWISSSVCEKSPLAVYISGSPGTGKTATLRLVLKKWKQKAFSHIINCVSIKTERDLIEAVFRSQEVTDRPSMTTFKQFLKDLKKPLILVLDEIDHLCTNTNSLLYSAFKWPQEMSTKLLVIGIANSIDLTERLLPKLKLSQPPKTLVFAPYTQETIKKILENKMVAEDTKLDSKAVELCARKVAAMSGDLRKALHVVNATKSAMTAESTAGGCREVLGVLNSVYSSPLARAKLPLQPRLLLAVCLCMSGNKKTNLTRTSLFNAYVKACDAVRVPPLENDDLSAAFQTLESQSFVSLTNNGHIRLQVDSTTARSVISDNAMIDQIGILCL